MLFSSELVTGKLHGIVLSLLKSHRRMSGYELAQCIREYESFCKPFNEAALYPILYSLEAQGLVITELECIDKRTRKYYSLSSKESKHIHKKSVIIVRFISALHFLLYIINNYILTNFIILSQLVFAFGRAHSSRTVRFKSSHFNYTHHLLF